MPDVAGLGGLGRKLRDSFATSPSAGLRYHTCLLSSTYQLMTNSPTYLPPSQPLVLPPPNVNINVTTLQAALAESLEREQQARGTRLLKG